MMTRARRQLRCLADTGSGFSKTGDPEPEVSEWRDWANLTTVFIEDIAGRLLSVDVSEYLRFRAVCQSWRDLMDDPRVWGVLEARFRPRYWIPLSKQTAPPSRLRLRNIATGARLGLDLPVLATSHLLSYVDGLFVLCDKATCAILLLHPLTGALAEFPIIPHVWDHSGTPVGIDAFRSRFSSQRTVLTRAGIDESTSPPTLQLPVWDEAWLVLVAKPGDAHWVPLYPPCMSMNQEMGMLRYTYLCAGQPLHQRVSIDESIMEMYDPLELGSSVKTGQTRIA